MLNIRTRRRFIVPALLAGIFAGVALYEHRVLAALDNSPDPDADHGFASAAHRVHAVATPDGGRLHAEEWGSGRPVVLLHGHGANLAIFAPLAERLSDGGMRVVAIDQRGFGRSTPAPPSFGFQHLVDDVATVLEQLDLRDATVVGHSMGGAVALGLAVEHPAVVAERVAAMVLINSAARGPADRPLFRAKAAALDWRVIEQVGRHHRHGLVLARANFGVEARRSHVVAARAIGLASPAASRQGLTRRLLGVDLSDRLGAVGVPTLVLAGSADRVLALNESVRIAELVPGAQLQVFHGAGHMLPVERTAEVAERILRFGAEPGVSRP